MSKQMSRSKSYNTVREGTKANYFKPFGIRLIRFNFFGGFTNRYSMRMVTVITVTTNLVVNHNRLDFKFETNY